MPRTWSYLQHPLAREVAVGLALLTPPKALPSPDLVILDSQRTEPVER